MNVAGAMVVGVEQEHRNHLDDRSVTGGGRFVSSLGRKRHVSGAVQASVAVRSVEVGYGLLDRVRRGANVFDVAIQDEGKRVRGFHVHRVTDRDDERAVAHRNGNSPVALGNFGIQRLQDIRRRRDGAQIDEFHAVLRGERSHNVLLRR